MGRIKKIIGAFIHAPERFDTLAERIAQQAERIDEKEAALHNRIDGINADWLLEQICEDPVRRIQLREVIQDGLMEWLCNDPARQNRLKEAVLDPLCEDRENLSRLNRGLSISPTVWGDPDRLEIDETAAVFTCFFNTNSGRIKIGESTFAGSGVSILAGAHDPKLTGYLRRDAEITEGCDIEIGKGVWLASGCTVLGPCKIGDNAVIAAGAVITPGTEVKEGEIWGGVPAKKIGTLEELRMAPGNPAVQKAFERSGGMLFADGWGERTPGILNVPGRWLYKKTAVVMTDRPEWKFGYRKDGSGSCVIRFKGPEGEEEVTLDASEGEAAVHLPVKAGELGEVTLEPEGGEKVFLAFWDKAACGQGDSSAAPAAPVGMTEKEPEAEKPEEKEPEEVRMLDIEQIMAEIRAEAAKREPYAEEQAFEQVSGAERRKAERLREQVEGLTGHYEIPANYQAQFPGRNPVQKVYKKFATKAMQCVAAPMGERVTQTNLAMKTALEKAVEVIEEQEKRIQELEKKINS